MFGRCRPLLPPGAGAVLANMLAISSLDVAELHGVAGCGVSTENRCRYAGPTLYLIALR